MRWLLNWVTIIVQSCWTNHMIHGKHKQKLTQIKMHSPMEQKGSSYTYYSRVLKLCGHKTGSFLKSITTCGKGHFVSLFISTLLINCSCLKKQSCNSIWLYVCVSMYLKDYHKEVLTKIYKKLSTVWLCKMNTKSMQRSLVKNSVSRGVKKDRDELLVCKVIQFYISTLP